MRSTLITRLAVVAVATLASMLVSAADANDSALRMVKKLRLGENLEAMSFQVAMNTQTGRNIVQAVGPQKAQSLVKDEINKVRPKYQEQWDKNLAASYVEFFTSDELESISEKGKASPHASKFFSKQGEVGRSMQAKSTDLLKELLAEALKNAFVQMVPRGK